MTNEIKTTQELNVNDIYCAEICEAASAIEDICRKLAHKLRHADMTSEQKEKAAAGLELSLDELPKYWAESFARILAKK